MNKIHFGKQGLEGLRKQLNDSNSPDINFLLKQESLDLENRIKKVMELCNLTIEDIKAQNISLAFITPEGVCKSFKVNNSIEKCKFFFVKNGA
jgi:hypothetical protein